MATGKINKRSIDALSPGDKDAYLWDSTVKGFALKVTPRGTKTYLFEYKNRSRTTRRKTIGRHGVLTADQARERAKMLAAEVELGGDPASDHTKHRAALTVAQLADEWLSDHVKTRRKAKTLGDYQGWVARHIVPAIGSMRVPDVQVQDVEKIVQSLSTHPTTANRVLAVISSMFTFAIRQHLVRDNPARGIEKNQERKRKRHLSAEELLRLGEVLLAAEERGDNQTGINALRFLLFTGMRRGEVETFRWSFVDWHYSRIHLPDSKTGEKTLPIGQPAIDLLKLIRDSQKQTSGQDENGFVFPSAKTDGHLVGLPKMWRKWRSEAGLEDVRIHDLRHSFASVGASGGTPLFVIGGILGHKSTATTDRYAHLQDDPARTAADSISTTIAAALNGPPKRENSNE
jgi:integrase